MQYKILILINIVFHDSQVTNLILVSTFFGEVRQSDTTLIFVWSDPGTPWDMQVTCHHPGAYRYHRNARATGLAATRIWGVQQSRPLIALAASAFGGVNELRLPKFNRSVDANDWLADLARVVLGIAFSLQYFRLGK